MLQIFWRRLVKLDWLLILAVFILFTFGISAIYSVELSHETARFVFLRKQIIALCIGLVASIFVVNMHYVQWRNLGRFLYIFGVILLVLVLIFGTNVRGTTGWFVFGAFSFQPVEFMKLALAVQLARYFSDHARKKIRWREIFISGFMTMVPTILTILQPDLGSATLLIGLWIVTLLFVGIRAKHVAVFGAMSFLLTIFSWLFVLRDYQKDRIAVFLNPSLDPLGAGYNVTQAKIAIGSGQWYGRGLGFGSQSQLRFLPESQTDFVFAVIAEELGFFGAMMIFAAMILLFWRIIHIAYNTRDPFASYLCVTIFSLFFVQMFLNIGVNLSLIPATGVALPFVSYGGSSLLISVILIAILQSVVVRRHPLDMGGKSDMVYLN